jgi:hypothetical protein
VLASCNQIHALHEIGVFDGKTFDVIEKRSAPPLDDTVERARNTHRLSSASGCRYRCNIHLNITKAVLDRRP